MSTQLGHSILLCTTAVVQKTRNWFHETSELILKTQSPLQLLVTKFAEGNQEKKTKPSQPEQGKVLKHEDSPLQITKSEQVKRHIQHLT